MKTLAIRLAIAAAVSAFAGQALAQNSATQSTTGSSTILQPITISKTTDLAFGKVVRPASGSNSVVINETTGARTLSGGGNAQGVTSTTSRAEYSVAGEGGQTFSITVPGSFDMTRSGGSETLTVTLVSTATSGTLSGSLGGSGTAGFGVGGSFPVATTTTPGAYSGTFDVTVAYN